MYWGNPAFVDEQIRILESGQGRRLGSGSFGVGWAVGSYLVKKTYDPTRATPKIPKSDFEQEADAANMLQDRIPDFVTQIKGARYSSGDRNDYIIFDLLQGDTLTGYITKLQAEAKNVKMSPSTLHRNLSFLFQALKVSSKAMSDLGWSHCDLKPDNLFFNVQQQNGVYVWSTAVCWLIDFGGATQFGKALPYGVTPLYSVTVLKTEFPNPNAACDLPIGTIDQLIRDVEINACKEQKTVSEKYNAASCNLIWLNDMKKLIVSTPKKPLTIEELGMTQGQYLVMRKSLIDRLRPLVQPPAMPVVGPARQAAAQVAAAQVRPLVQPPAMPVVGPARQAAAQIAAAQAAQRNAAARQVEAARKADAARQAAQEAVARQDEIVKKTEAALQAARQAAARQAVPQPKNKSPRQPVRLTGHKRIFFESRIYRQLTDNKETWWDDLSGKAEWDLPKGKLYIQVTDGLDRWWQDPSKKTSWVIPEETPQTSVVLQYTGKKLMSDGIRKYHLATDNKDTWWEDEDPKGESRWEIPNGILYKEVRNSKEIWWEDPSGILHWSIPIKESALAEDPKAPNTNGATAAKAKAAEIAAMKKQFNAQVQAVQAVKGGSRTRRRSNKSRQSRQSR